MVSQITLARPYAKAAFAMARDHRALGGWHALLALAAQIAHAPSVRGLLNHPQIGDADLRALFELPKSDVDPTVRAQVGDFLDVLIANRRLGVLPEIATQFASLRADFERTLKVRVVSALPIASDQQSALIAALTKRFDRQVEIDLSLDPALVGGAVIHADDTVIDGSLRGKLDKLKTALAA
jgi:F-type H+-transporting ATPase subunit delta